MVKGKEFLRLLVAERDNLPETSKNVSQANMKALEGIIKRLSDIKHDLSRINRNNQY